MEVNLSELHSRLGSRPWPGMVGNRSHVLAVRALICTSDKKCVEQQSMKRGGPNRQEKRSRCHLRRLLLQGVEGRGACLGLGFG